MIPYNYCEKSKYLSRCDSYIDHVDSCTISFSKGRAKGKEDAVKDNEEEIRKLKEKIGQLSETIVQLRHENTELRSNWETLNTLVNETKEIKKIAKNHENITISACAKVDEKFDQQEKNIARNVEQTIANKFSKVFQDCNEEEKIDLQNDYSDKIIVENGQISKFITCPVIYPINENVVELLRRAREFNLCGDFELIKININNFMNEIFMNEEGLIGTIIMDATHIHHKEVVQFLSNIVEILSSAARNSGQNKIAHFVEGYLKILPQDDIIERPTKRYAIEY